MRQSLALTHNQLPFFTDSFTATESKVLEEKNKEWLASDFAGFRRLLDKNSAEYPDTQQIKTLASQCQTGSTGKKIKHFVLLGTGGSSLGAEAILRCLHSPWKEPFFHFLDNNDPDWFHWLLRDLPAEETLFYVVSKSGKTPETISQFMAAKQWLEKKLPANYWKKHFVLSTDPQKGDLRQIAQRFELPCLSIPSAVGGRFSVLSSVGLFPAAFAGLGIEKFLSGAKALAEKYEALPLQQNDCALLAKALAKAGKERPITVMMPYSSKLGAFSRWFCQLWAESLGKNGLGLTPYPAIGTTDQHSQMQLYMEGPKDKSMIFLHIQKRESSLPLAEMPGTDALSSFRDLQNKSMLELFEAEFFATRDAITKNGVPNITVELECLDEYSLGALFFFFEWVTSYAGAYMGINPFDQPGVEAAKILTKRYLLGLGK